jgi:pyochelin biosynthetic protein PchC
VNGLRIHTPFILSDKEVTAGIYKLICLPCAGGGASGFIRWSTLLAGKMCVLPIQLPGREERIDEPFLSDMEDAAAQIAGAVGPYLESGRFSVFGHSMGGALAYRLTKHLEKMGLKADLCFISSCSIDGMQGRKPSGELNDHEFMMRVAEYGAVDETSEAFQYPELREILMRILRADFALDESFRDTGEKISAPICIVCGREDQTETISRMRSWGSYTTAGLYSREFPGGHFFLEEHDGEVCDAIVQISESCGKFRKWRKG